MAKFMHEKQPRLGPYKPTLIIHGGAGAISRANLPPELYEQYHKSLEDYLKSTRALLDAGKSALEAACYAVSMFEDDPLFNCGRGSVFTKAGTIEMEASVMVASVSASDSSEGSIKRGAAVSLIRNTRHPILLAKEVLLDADQDQGMSGTSSMHCHLSGIEVERWGWDEKRLEKKDDDWFWTKKRWDEHRRGLSLSGDIANFINQEGKELPSQGTVGAVCMDSWGNLSVATSTGGLTNKAVGRIGDTPTIGAGFWAEAWDTDNNVHLFPHHTQPFLSSDSLIQSIMQPLLHCIPTLIRPRSYTAVPFQDSMPSVQSEIPYSAQSSTGIQNKKHDLDFRRAIAMSGTGNGDSFLRIDAARTVAAMCRFFPRNVSLAEAVTSVAGPEGELQRSAGNRWMKTGEGQGGIIGIEVSAYARTPSRPLPIEADVVFDFNCGGLWRAWYCIDAETGIEYPKVMVFKDEYKP